MWAVFGARLAIAVDPVAAAKAVGRSARWGPAQLEVHPEIAAAAHQPERGKVTATDSVTVYLRHLPNTTGTVHFDAVELRR